MSTVASVNRIVKVSQSASSDQAKTEQARMAHERALAAIERAIKACRRLSRTGDSKAAREARVLAAALHRLSDPLFQTFTPLCEAGRWTR